MTNPASPPSRLSAEARKFWRSVLASAIQAADVGESRFTASGDLQVLRADPHDRARDGPLAASAPNGPGNADPARGSGTDQNVGWQRPGPPQPYLFAYPSCP